MVRTLAALVVLAVLPSPSFGAIALDAASVGAGPYYLDRAGETYVLSDDISVPGTAFVFAAENVTLDLNGHTVTFGAAVGKYRYGVVVPPPYAHVNPIFSQSDVTRWLSCSGATVRNGSMTQGEARSDSCAAVLAYGESRITLESGDLLVCFTDGITEPENEYGEMFGEQGFGNFHRNNTTVVSHSGLAEKAKARHLFVGASAARGVMLVP